MTGAAKLLIGSILSLLLGGGAVAAYTLLGGETDPEENYKWQWLYKYATKVFSYLKSKNSSGSNAVTQDNLISWLKEKLKDEEDSTEQTNTSNDQTWENFRDICQARMHEEDDSDNMEKPALRICFLDEKPSGKEAIGDLSIWSTDTLAYKGFTTVNKEWEKTNLELWEDFRKKYSEGYSDNDFESWLKNTEGDEETRKIKTNLADSNES